MNSVEIKKYLARHNVVYNSRILREQPAIFGTGKIGACIWQEQEDLYMQISNVDSSPQSQMSSGILRISSQLDSSSVAILNIFDGEFSIDYSSGVSFLFYGSGSSFDIAVRDTRKNISTEVSLELWNTDGFVPENFRFARMVKKPQDWASATVVECDNCILFSRGSTSGYGEQGVDIYEDISDETIFGYTLAVGISGAEVISKNNKLSFSSQNYTIKVANPTRLENIDTVSCAKKRLQANLLQNNCSIFWNNYWEKSHIVYNFDGNDYAENIYYVSRYVLACGMSGTYPMHFISGVFRNGGDNDTVWAVAYWWYNQRCVYGGMMSTGFWKFTYNQLMLYFNNMPKMLADTKNKYPNSIGMVVAETMAWDGRRSFCENSEGAMVAEYINCTGIEVSLKMYDYYEYSGDENFLKNVFLPFASECVNFNISHELKLNNDGKYYIPSGISNARETYLHIENPITSLAALRAILPKIIKTLDSEKQDSAKYCEVLEKLIEFEFGGYPKRFSPGKNGFDYIRRNWDDPCMELVYPFDLAGNGKPFYNEIVANYNGRIGRDKIMSCLTWDNSSIWAARLGLSDDCMNNITWQIIKSQVMSNGIGTDGNCKYEFSGNQVTAINESLLQSYDGIIRVFPAVYQNEKNSTAYFKLYAKGGFTVESEYDYAKFQAKYVEITSNRGNDCKIFNPYGCGRIAQIICNECIVMESDNEVLEFCTKIGGNYIVKLKGTDIVKTAFKSYENRNKKTFLLEDRVRQLGN